MSKDASPFSASGPAPLGRDALIVAAVIVAFSTAHFGLRALVTPAVHGDDADLIVFDQSLQWGYHAQPPLYSWLYRGVTVVCGRNLLSLNLLRTGLLAGAAWMMYLSLRQLVNDPRVSRLGAYSLLAAPAVAWHAITYLTHTLLVCLACLAALHAAIGVVKRGRWGDYTWLGVVCGLGALSKYNFAVFAVALFVGGLAVPAIRPKLLTPRMVIAVLLAVAVVAPHGLWLVENVDAIRGEYDHKLDNPDHSGVAHALADLYKNLLLVGAPTVAIFFGCFPGLYKRSGGERPAASPYESWFAWYFVAVAAIYTVAILVADATRFHERWLEPLMLMLPVLLLCRVERIGFSAPDLRRYAATLALLAVVTLGVRGGQVVLGNSHRGYISMDYLYDGVAEHLAEVAAGDAVIVVDDHAIGGNLINCRPAIDCVCADHTAYQPAWSRGRDEYVLVWHADRGEAVPERLSRYADAELGLTAVGEPIDLDVSPLYAGQEPGRLRCVKARRSASVAGASPRRTR